MNMDARIAAYFYIFVSLLCIPGSSYLINSTGSSGDVDIYAKVNLAYRFSESLDSVSYFPAGSIGAKCNIMGYWYSSNILTSGSSTPPSIKKRDTAICMDVCTTAVCGTSEARFDRFSRTPLTDFGISDSVFSAADYKYFPDLQMLPALTVAVAPVYNIPELCDIPLVLSRATIADIFIGKISYWNDSRIVADNNGPAATILTKIPHNINIVTRTEASGTSEIFSTALSQFSSNSGSDSFASVVGTSVTPAWCGQLTDEVQVVTIYGCNSTQTSTIHLVFIDGTYAPRDLYFSCQASAQNVAQQFTAGLDVTVARNQLSISGQTIQYTVGFSDPQTASKNWYKLKTVSVPAGLTVNVTTLQEGGYQNSHYNLSGYFVTPVTQSIWLSKTASSFQFRISWYSTNSNSQFTTNWISYNNGNNIAQSITNEINALVTEAVDSVYMSDHTLWSEYQIKFSTSSQDALSFVNFDIGLSGAGASSAYIITLTDGNNYPLFYDSAHANNQDGSGRYTCYSRHLDYQPWSYYTGTANVGVIAQVSSLAYSIGYTALSSAMQSTLPMASIINKAGYIIKPSPVSVAYAGAVKEISSGSSNFTVVLADSAEPHSWPIAGYSYFIYRKNVHIGSCSQRKSAMKYLYNFYYSATAKQLANRLGYAPLPENIRDAVVATLVSTAKCSNGQYALQEYVAAPRTILSPAPFSSVVDTYLSVFNPTDDRGIWSAHVMDDSRNVWNTFINNPSKYTGVFTMFGSKSQKLQYYENWNQNVITYGFANIAVVLIYRLDTLTQQSNIPLRITPLILEGIFTGSIQTWDDARIAQANPQISAYLTNTPITVVVQSTHDTNSIFLRYLNIISTNFQQFYRAGNGDDTYQSFDFSSAISSDRLIRVSANSIADDAVSTRNGALGYYLQVDTPGSNVASFCKDSKCTTAVINPSDSGKSITRCLDDSSTAVNVNPSPNIRTYDLMSSTAAGCYPIVGTVDFSMYIAHDENTCSAVDSSGDSILYSKVKLGAFLYNGSSVVSPLSAISVAPTSADHRQNALQTMCDLTCNNAVLGLAFCGYRYCSWDEGDYQQTVSSCDSVSHKRTVNYTLISQSHSTCIFNAGLAPPPPTSIECPYVDYGSFVSNGVVTMCAIGAGICFLIIIYMMRFSHKRVMRRSQPTCLYMSVIGALFMNLSVLSLLGQNSDYNCTMRVWTFNLSSTLMVAPLIVKLHGAQTVYKYVLKGSVKRKRMSSWVSMAEALAILLVDVGICLLWMYLRPPRVVSTDRTYAGTYASITDDVCSTGIGDPLETAEIVWKAFLLCLGLYKAAQTWNLNMPGDISEAKYFVMAIYNTTMIGCFAYFVSVYGVGATNAQTAVMLKSMGMCAAATTFVVIIVVPKLMAMELTLADLLFLRSAPSEQEESGKSSVPGSVRTVNGGYAFHGNASNRIPANIDNTPVNSFRAPVNNQGQPSEAPLSGKFPFDSHLHFDANVLSFSRVSSANPTPRVNTGRLAPAHSPKRVHIEHSENIQQHSPPVSAPNLYAPGMITGPISHGFGPGPVDTLPYKGHQSNSQEREETLKLTLDRRLSSRRQLLTGTPERPLHRHSNEVVEAVKHDVLTKPHQSDHPEPVEPALAIDSNQQSNLTTPRAP